MKFNLIIDKDLSKYQPQFNFSKVNDIESINLNKYKEVYLFIDDLNLFNNTFELCNKNVTFIYNYNIKFQSNKLEIKIISCEENKNNFLNKIIKQDFIKNYLGIKGGK